VEAAFEQGGKVTSRDDHRSAGGVRAHGRCAELWSVVHGVVPRAPGPAHRPSGGAQL